MEYGRINGRLYGSKLFIIKVWTGIMQTFILKVAIENVNELTQHLASVIMGIPVYFQSSDE